MPTVEVPEAALTDAGISKRYATFNLAALKKHAKYKEQYSSCCKFTTLLSNAIDKGVGLTLFGEETTVRQYAMYGVAKAAIAQGRTVQVVTVEDIVQAHSDGSALYKQCLSVELVVVTELEVPESVANSYFKSIAYKFFKSRLSRGKPVVVCTSLELDHPDHSIDLLLPGVGKLLIQDTVLISFDTEGTCEWLARGNRQTLATLADTLEDTLPRRTERKTASKAGKKVKVKTRVKR